MALVHRGRRQGVAVEGVLDAYGPALVVAPAAGDETLFLELFAGA